jgi:hypothetical protein
VASLVLGWIIVAGAALALALLSAYRAYGDRLPRCGTARRGWQHPGGRWP